MDLSFSKTSSNTRIVINDSPGGTNINIFVPSVPNTDGTGHQRVIEILCEGKKGAMDVASLGAESAPERVGPVEREAVRRGGANPVVKFDTSVPSSVSDSNAGLLGDGHVGGRVNLASLPTMPQRLLAQTAFEQTSLEAKLSPQPSSRVSGSATHAVRDTQNANASVLRFKTAQGLPVPRKEELGLYPTMGSGLAERRESVYSGPIVDSGNASAPLSHDMDFESNQPSAVAIDAVKVEETNVHMDVDVGAHDVLDIYGDEHSSDPLFSQTNGANAPALSHNVSAHDETPPTVRENPVADPRVALREETIGKIAKVDLSLRRSTSAKAGATAAKFNFAAAPSNAGFQPGEHAAFITQTKDMINENVNHHKPMTFVNELDKLHNKEIVTMNQNKVHTSKHSSSPFDGIEKSVSQTNIAPTVGASQKGKPEVGRRHRQVQYKDKALVTQGKNYAEPLSTAPVDKDANGSTTVSKVSSQTHVGASLAKASTADIAIGSHSRSDVPNDVDTGAILAAATTGHQVRVEERWEKVRQLSADLKRENESLKCEKAVLVKANEELRKKVEELTKELETMNLKGPKEAKGARAMKGTKKPNDGESQKKALPITKPKTANANAKEADPDGKQSKFMNSWAGVKRTADEMQASGGTSNQSGKEQLSPQSNKKRKINSQNNHK